MSKVRQRSFEAPPGQVAVLAHEYPHGYVVPPHQHRSHQVVYGSAGVMTVHVAGTSYLVPPQRALWVPASVIHAIDISGVVSMRTLYLSPSLWRSAPRQCRVLVATPLLRALVLHAVTADGLNRRRARDARLIAVLLDELRAQPETRLQLATPQDARARRIAERVLGEPGRDSTLRELARGSGASARTAERLFRKEAGTTFGQWRRQARLIHALRHLAMGESVTNASMEAGYSSVSAFVLAFRLAFGTTPGKFLR